MTLAERLRSTDVAECIAAIGVLANRGSADPDELGALAECLGHVRKAVQRPAADAFATLGAAGVDVAPALDRALASPVARQRWGAAFALSLIGEPPARTLPVLLETLGEDDGDMRWAAAAILLRLTDRAGLVASLTDLVAGGNAPQRKMALYCLRDVGARFPAVERVVVSALDDDDEGVRLAAIAGLARLALDRGAAAGRLIAALEAEDERCRRAAAAALGALGERSDRVIAALRAAAAAPDPSLVRAASGALRALGVDATG
jgi:HEAT repeat protein